MINYRLILISQTKKSKWAAGRIRNFPKEWFFTPYLFVLRNEHGGTTFYHFILS